jgi:predicted nucleic acid-binding protein
MRVLADTPVWSAAFRRAPSQESPYRAQMEKLIAAGLVEIIGPIRQELLSGIRELDHFHAVRGQLRSFKDLVIASEDYEMAASYFNRCRLKGIQGSSTDFVICAVAIRHNLVILTPDQDFLSYRKVLPIELYI